MDQLVLDICRAVRACGETLLKADRSHMGIDAKAGAANFVTEYDTRVQGQLFEALGSILPQARFVGEEGEEAEVNLSGWCFIVDPIDGTTNFIKDYRMSCVSVGLLLDGIPEIGVVYNPYLDEMFYARRGMGAYCNGERIHVSREPPGKGYRDLRNRSLPSGPGREVLPHGLGLFRQGPGYPPQRLRGPGPVRHRGRQGGAVF